MAVMAIKPCVVSDAIQLTGAIHCIEETRMTDVKDAAATRSSRPIPPICPDNLEGDLTIDHLASIACLSRFHFARAFKAPSARQRGASRACQNAVDTKRSDLGRILHSRSTFPAKPISHERSSVTPTSPTWKVEQTRLCLGRRRNSAPTRRRETKFGSNPHHDFGLPIGD
jgi:AraC-like DNA-binding protein